MHIVFTLVRIFQIYIYIYTYMYIYIYIPVHLLIHQLEKLDTRISYVKLYCLDSERMFQQTRIEDQSRVKDDNNVAVAE